MEHTCIVFLMLVRESHTSRSPNRCIARRRPDTQEGANGAAPCGRIWRGEKPKATQARRKAAALVSASGGQSQRRLLRVSSANALAPDQAPLHGTHVSLPVLHHRMCHVDRKQCRTMPTYLPYTYKLQTLFIRHVVPSLELLALGTRGT